MYQQIARNKRRTVLLIAVFIAIFLVLGYVFDRLLGGYGTGGIIMAVFLSLAMALFSYYSGDKVALWSSGAKPLAKGENLHVERLVENLSITAGMPVPKIYLINDPGLNAFATGRDPQHASIAVTTGIVQALENEELEGVIAHELSHIKNYDIRVMTIVIVLVGAIALLADFFLRAQFFGFGGRSRDREGGAAFAILALLGLILAILSPIIAQLIQLAVSRRREFLADASGVLLTRYPEGLARALEKIAQSARPVMRASNATAHLWIANPFAGGGRRITSLFSTHPPIEERIKALREMAT